MGEYQNNSVQVVAKQCKLIKKQALHPLTWPGVQILVVLLYMQAYNYIHKNIKWEQKSITAMEAEITGNT